MNESQLVSVALLFSLTSIAVALSALFMLRRGWLPAYLGSGTTSRDSASLDVGIDLDAETTLVSVRGRKGVLGEPSWVAFQKGTNRVLKVGAQAEHVAATTPAEAVVDKPLRRGLTADPMITQAMLKHFIGLAREATPGPMASIRLGLGVPGDMTEEHLDILYEAARAAGASEVHLVGRASAAALAAARSVVTVLDAVVVDIGDSLTEVEVISKGGILLMRSLRMGVMDLVEDIIEFVGRQFHLLIEEDMAWQIGVTIGLVQPAEEEQVMTVRGRSSLTGIAESRDLTYLEIQPAMQPWASVIVDVTRDALLVTPPEVADAIMELGICLTSRGSLVRGLAERLTRDVGINTWIPDEPTAAVARGSGAILEDLGKYERLLVGAVQSTRRRGSPDTEGWFA